MQPVLVSEFATIIQEGERPFSMFKDLYGKYDWVLSSLEYGSKEALIENLEEAIINRALDKHRQLVARKSKQFETLKLPDS